jgi:biotin synthase
VALDAVTLELFDRTRGRDPDSPHKRGEYWRPLERAAEIYGTAKFGAPLICGAGEARPGRKSWRRRRIPAAWATIIIMFALFPERGSLMEDREPVR